MSDAAAALLSSAAEAMATVHSTTEARVNERRALDAATAVLFAEPTPEQLAMAQLVVSLVGARKLARLEADR